MRQRRPPFKETKHGADLAGGAARYVEECEQLVCCAAFEALCDVVGNRERRAIKLVAFGPRDVIPCGLDEVLGTLCEPDRLLPDGQVFETLIRRHGVES